MLAAGAIVGLATSHNFNLPWTETQITEAITTLVFAILAYYDAKYPNTFINKTTETKVEVTPTELEKAIQEAQKETTPTEDGVEDDQQ